MARMYHVEIIKAKGDQKELEEAKEYVDAVVQTAQKEGIPAESLTPAGRPHDAIIEAAGGRGVDLIVMGTYGRTGLKKFLMGSSTERVIGRAGCGILVVKDAKAARQICAVKRAA